MIRMLMTAVFVVALLVVVVPAAEAIQATVTWTDAAEADPGNTQTGWRVYRRDGVDTNPYVQQGADLAANVLTFNQAGLLLGTRYCYQVESFNTFGVAARQPVNGACGTPDAPLPASGVTVIFAP